MVGPRTQADRMDPREREAANRALLRRIQDGDDGAMNQLIHRNRGLVRTGLEHLGLSVSPYRDELEQEGLIALYSAAKRWDPTRGVKYSTFAMAWITGAMRRRADQVNGFATIPTSLRRHMRLVSWAIGELLREGVSEPRTERIAEIAGLSNEQVEKALLAMRPVGELNGGADEERAAVGFFSEEVDPDDQLDQGSRRSEAVRLLEQLPEREKSVLGLRFGLGGREPASVDEVAQKLGVSAERIRQIEARALNDLRRAARAPGL